MAKKEIKKHGAGAPKKPDGERKGTNGLTNQQNKWLDDYAVSRNISFKAAMRLAVDWFITAIETRRGDVSANEGFDDVYQVATSKRDLKI